MPQFPDDVFREKLIKMYYPEILKYRTDFYRGKINWNYLSMNSEAIDLLEQNLDKINWYLSGNPNAIYLLSQNLDKIDWIHLSGNPNAIYLLEAILHN